MATSKLRKACPLLATYYLSDIIAMIQAMTRDLRWIKSRRKVLKLKILKFRVDNIKSYLSSSSEKVFIVFLFMCNDPSLGRVMITRHIFLVTKLTPPYPTLFFIFSFFSFLLPLSLQQLFLSQCFPIHKD